MSDMFFHEGPNGERIASTNEWTKLSDGTDIRRCRVDYLIWGVSWLGMLYNYKKELKV